MSGMEPLIAFGLVCNVFQAIQFVGQTVSMSKKAFQTGSPDPGLAQSIDDSAELYDNLVKSIQSASPLTEDEIHLVRIAEKIRDAADEVKRESKRLTSPTAKGDIVAAVLGGVKAKWSENKLEKLEKKVQGYQRLLESGTLGVIW